jgi:GT2 family glycosyltransferase
MNSPITFCLSTYNNLNYLKLAVFSVRKNSYFRDAPFIVHAENCDDGTDEWLAEVKDEYNLEYYIEKNEIPVGIGGGMNFCADKVKTEYIMFLHSDFYVSKNWDIACLEEHKLWTQPVWVFPYRIQPNIFNEASRPGTYIVDIEEMGSTYSDFDILEFENAAEELSQQIAFKFRKAEGVSGLIKKTDWDKIGGNDPLFAPASWEDMDLFLRMIYEGYEFVVTNKSVVWHFGARGSHRLEENNGQSSQRQRESEASNFKKWINKWGRLPVFDELGMIKKW